ncbi:hypothetical protein SESBI_46079 [Sesbania bispinosa]|nr:hypothetical protein SESBI_46079 [Sesbania bispinosa]
MRVKPIAVIIRVEGRPNLRWLQKVNVYARFGARRACSRPIKLASDPNSDRFPAMVLTHAKMSHAFFSSSLETAAAEAATLVTSNKTGNYKQKIGKGYMHQIKIESKDGYQSHGHIILW